MPSWSSWSGCRYREIKQRIELMAITEIVLRELNTQLEDGFSHDLPVPFFHVVHGQRVRDLL